MAEEQAHADDSALPSCATLMRWLKKDSDRLSAASERAARRCDSCRLQAEELKEEEATHTSIRRSIQLSVLLLTTTAMSYIRSRKMFQWGSAEVGFVLGGLATVVAMDSGLLEAPSIPAAWRDGGTLHSWHVEMADLHSRQARTLKRVESYMCGAGERCGDSVRDLCPHYSQLQSTQADLADMHACVLSARERLTAAAIYDDEFSVQMEKLVHVCQSKHVKSTADAV
eukprot:PLAT14491.1.p1 GENE.PLAT14491.1~~PLAT14491.1.p1  ORF type:complete len:239 (-),score=85.59 PLAT14491.1:82-762(-)